MPQSALAVLNNSGSSIAAGSVVYITGYTRPAQLSTVALASAAAAATAVRLGIMIKVTADGDVGQVLFAGDHTVNTSSFSAVGDNVFLSNTPGAIATSAGTVSKVIATVKTVGASGSITLICQN